MKNTLIDSHCHLDRLDLTAYEGKLQGALEHARQLHVNKMLCVSIDLEAYPSMRDLVRDYDEVSISVGVHPNETEGHEPTVEELVELARDDKVVAIGETGLDYFRSEGDLEWQRDRFRTHIRAAKIAKKPLIIHSREAREDTIRVLQEENAHEVGGVMHCFSEDWDMAERALALNFYISFSGIVTFKTAETLRDVARRVPLDRILIDPDIIPPGTDKRHIGTGYRSNTTVWTPIPRILLRYLFVAKPMNRPTCITWRRKLPSFAICPWTRWRPSPARTICACLSPRPLDTTQGVAI